eukprot:TRINITY_DN544_c0_g1_i4.p1 TRINITY_DN544_c0_g1~~TRINITY_DN544_c0_g1_i4.p1  ORF type:complete len:293 (+),score=41.42 TRINITY_DN544_c0_g1_i4:566-1444(+)
MGLQTAFFTFMWTTMTLIMDWNEAYFQYGKRTDVNSLSAAMHGVNVKYYLHPRFPALQKGTTGMTVEVLDELVVNGITVLSHAFKDLFWHARCHADLLLVMRQHCHDTADSRTMIGRILELWKVPGTFARRFDTILHRISDHNHKNCVRSLDNLHTMLADWHTIQVDSIKTFGRYDKDDQRKHAKTMAIHQSEQVDLTGCEAESELMFTTDGTRVVVVFASTRIVVLKLNGKVLTGYSNLGEVRVTVAEDHITCKTPSPSPFPISHSSFSRVNCLTALCQWLCAVGATVAVT